MKKRKVCFIGSISDKLDGQTVKTKILYDELKNGSDWHIYLVNTANKKKDFFFIILKTFAYLFKCKDVIIIVSQNGRRFFFPILYTFSKMFKRRIYHNVIGGCLQEYAKEYKKFPKYLNSFKVNWVESSLMKKELEKLGVNNAIVMPNFKQLEYKKNGNITSKATFKFCTFSRVVKEKGIEDAIDAVNNINNKLGNICSLDIYGMIDDDYKEEFDEIMKKTPKQIRYKGLIPYDKSTDVLHNYYALLFPTYWPGEGCPGTVIDAYASSLPIIATDWNCNSEFIKNYKTGIIYPNKEIKTLEEAIIWSIDNKDKMKKMSLACGDEVKKYNPKFNVQKIINEINQNKE